MACGAHSTAAVTSNGELYVWGRHTYSNSPHAVPLPSPVRTVACGAEHMAAVTQGGALWTWGYNEKGQLGHGDTFDGLRRPRRVLHFARAADCDAEHAEDSMNQQPKVLFASMPHPDPAHTKKALLQYAGEGPRRHRQLC